MAQLVRLVVIKRNGKVLTYPTREDIVATSMYGIVSLANGGTRFSVQVGNKPIPVIYEVEQTVAQIKALANQPGANVSA